MTFHDLHGPVLWYRISMIPTSILCGIISMYFLYQFRAYSSYRFIKLRRPSLIFLYSIATIFTLTVLCPINFYLTTQIFSHEHHAEPAFFQTWLNYLLQEFIIASMLILITARCWLLYFDHSYNVSLVDHSWRGVISNDKNFWLKSRKTWGDVGFITFVSFTIAVVVLVALCSVSIYTFAIKNADVLHLVNLILGAMPCLGLLCFIIYSNHVRKLVLYDEFMIIEEMQYLALCIVLLTVCYIIDLCEYRLIHQASHIAFCFASNFVQTRWVVTKLDRLNKTTVSKAPNATNLTMSEVLKDKDGFTMFMRHCQNELNVEGLLFIVEVAQYKAQLHDRIRETDTEDDTCKQTVPPPRKQSKHVMDVDVFVEHDWMSIAKQLFRTNSNDPEHAIKLELSEDAKDEKMKDVVQMGEEDEMFYEAAQYLFLKYIDVESDLMINVSHTIRKELLLFFSKERQKGFEFIIKSKSEKPVPALVRSLMIKQHLYGAFDEALGEIWELLSSDTYFRFLHTKQYQYLITKVKHLN
eukprot:82649_1